MDKVRIENVPVNTRKAYGQSGALSTEAMCTALMSLKVGQSFVVDLFSSNNRNVINITHHVTALRFASTKTESGQVRIGRIS